MDQVVANSVYLAKGKPAVERVKGVDLHKVGEAENG